MTAVLALLIGALVGAAVAWMIRGRRVPADAVATEIPPQLPPRVLEEALSTLAAGAVVLDGRDRVVLANRTAEELKLVRGRGLAIPALGRLVADLRRSGRPAEVELDMPGGPDLAAVRVRAALAGTTGHAVLLVDDITEARRVEAVRRDFVANVSHELKTPVGALALLAEAIHDGEGDAETVRRFAGRMVHEAGRLSRLVQELIDLSRLQGAEASPAATVVRIDHVVREAVDRSRLRADAKQITLSAESDLALEVRGDESQLVTAIGNLLDNAIAYSAPGTRVALGVRRRDDVVEVTVTDEGIGIASDDLERIFERFYRADPARSRETGGTGLGLAIVKHIAGNHGGRVTVWSVEGTGSTFTVHLPLVIDEARTDREAVLS
ncbi:MAG TPA: ATP-binding protein [Mycobacteriales bacterium]|nr:ATP-binding protein [Mycobacteriales bacterium]